MRWRKHRLAHNRRSYESFERARVRWYTRPLPAAFLGGRLMRDNAGSRSARSLDNSASFYVERGIGPGSWKGPNVDQHGDLRITQHLNQLINGSVGMPNVMKVAIAR